jgi:hypothetical protein
MKNTLKLLISSAIAIAAIMYNANAQATNITSLVNYYASYFAGSVKDTGKNNELYSTAYKRALKDFQKTFAGINDVTWYDATSGGYIARFMQNDVKTIVAYNPKGNWSYTIHYYGEKKLPEDVRGIVKRTYYDYSIFGVSEVHFREQTVYIIYIQDENKFKTIRVYDNEMDELASYPKG